MTASEWQFDGLVGPTHNYAGLAHGNVASAKNAGAISNPRAAALQGIQKMRFVRGLGVKQAFLPPHLRPQIALLQSLGFGQGRSREAIAHTLELAYNNAPHLLASVYSSSFMWAANAATISPSADTADGKLHLTPANLVSHFHRAIEAPFTTQLLRRIFHDTQHFTVHAPLPATTTFSDEGAANHMRVAVPGNAQGSHIYVYGTDGAAKQLPQRYLARQQRVASEVVARQHGVAQAQYIQQSPHAIDAGVFHNDVIAMNTHGLMIVHEMAFADQHAAIAQLNAIAGLNVIEIATIDLPIADAVKSYLFNSQLLYVNGIYVLVAPIEAQENTAANAVVQKLLAQGALGQAHFLDVRESMRNGGGPACLRLRVSMTDAEAAAIHPGVIATDAKLSALEAWITTHYRDQLSLNDLRDPKLVTELQTAYAALEEIIGMDGLYDL